MAPRAIRILGLDPGSRHTGYGVVDKVGSRLTVVEAGTLSPPGRSPLEQRLHAIHAALVERIEVLQPATVAVEDIFHAVNARSALQLAHLRGVLIMAVAGARLPLGAYTPATIKKAVTGSGAAGKEQVAYMMERLLGVNGKDLRSDATDALAVAVCHASHLGTLGTANAAAATGGTTATETAATVPVAKVSSWSPDGTAPSPGIRRTEGEVTTPAPGIRRTESEVTAPGPAPPARRAR